jgi:hypothetical protein
MAQAIRALAPRLDGPRQARPAGIVTQHLQHRWIAAPAAAISASAATAVAAALLGHRDGCDRERSQGKPGETKRAVHDLSPE